MNAMCFSYFKLCESVLKCGNNICDGFMLIMDDKAYQVETRRDLIRIK